jgi:hypothetical protein
MTVAAWHLLDLTRDISRAQTHLLALTLRRTDSSNPRTMYNLIETEVVPWDFVDQVFSKLGNFTDSSPVSPRRMLAQNAEERKRDGALGAVMVISLELPEGDNTTPRQALAQVRISFS